jgi:hypothetical protein
MRFKEITNSVAESEIIDEVSMSPSNLDRFANSPEADGMLMGIEFEMYVPDVAGRNYNDPEDDYSEDERAYYINDIIEFYGNSHQMSRRELESLRNDMSDQYLDWVSENLPQDRVDELIREKLEEFIIDEEGDELEQEAEELARAELSDPQLDDIHDIKIELLRNRVAEIMSEADSREYYDAYDEAREEVEEEFRDSGDGDEEAWLSSIGIDNMSDVPRRFDVSWPYQNWDNGGSQDIESVGESFEESTGYRARVYDDYHKGDRDLQKREGSFIIEPDGSLIKPSDPEDAGLEFISPAVPLKDGLEMLRRVQSWANQSGCYTNSTTGLHMNISVPGMSRNTLDYVKLTLFLGDQHILQQFQREYNIFCQSAMKIVKQNIQNNPNKASQLLDQMKSQLNAEASKLIHSGYTDKYTSINTKDGYVEFRGPGNDYLSQDITMLTNTALRLAMSLKIATDPNAYKQEYAKKLYRLTRPTEFSTKVNKRGETVNVKPMANDMTSLFTKYAAGDISKQQLIADVKGVQSRRASDKELANALSSDAEIERELDMEPETLEPVEQVSEDISRIRKLAGLGIGMKSKEFMLEYRRDKTAQSMGSKLVSALANDRGNIGNLAKERSIAISAKQGNEVSPEEIAQITDSVLAAIESMDPTPNKQFTQWLARMYANGGLKLEDMNRNDTLTTYEIGKQRKLINPEHADINRFKSYQDFENALSNYDADEIRNSNKQEVDKGTAETVYDDADVRVIHPKDESAACYYGKGTRWCTAATKGHNYFNTYNSEGPMYILLPKHPEFDGEKYQLHFPSGQFMNEEDDPVKLDELIKKRFPGLESFFREKEADYFNNNVIYASDAVLNLIIKKVKDEASDFIYEKVIEWEDNDDYYRDWKEKEAIERGYVDSDGDVDWDRVHEDDDLNDYLDFNYEAQEWLNNANEAFNVSPEMLRDAAREYEEWMKLDDLDVIYEGFVQEAMRRDEGYSIVRWLNERRPCYRIVKNLNSTELVSEDISRIRKLAGLR